MTLQNPNNLLSCYLLGLVTLGASRDINTNKSDSRMNLNKSYDCVDNSLSIDVELYNSFIRCIYQYIYHTAKLFCFVGWRREYNNQLAGEYLRLVSFLVTNHPDKFSKTKRGQQP